MLLRETLFWILYSMTPSSMKTTRPLYPMREQNSAQILMKSYQLASFTMLVRPRSLRTSDFRSYSPFSHLREGMSSLPEDRSVQYADTTAAKSW